MSEAFSWTKLHQLLGQMAACSCAPNGNERWRDFLPLLQPLQGVTTGLRTALLEAAKEERDHESTSIRPTDGGVRGRVVAEFRAQVIQLPTASQ